MLVVMTLSMIVQFVAAFMAIRMIRLSGTYAAWMLLACGFIIQGIRRGVSVHHLLFGLFHGDMTVEILGLLISVFMMLGIWKFRPLFDEIKRSHQVLIDRRDELTLLNKRLEGEVAARSKAEVMLRSLNEALDQRVALRTKELERLNGELEQFCYCISHEFRAPIARLQGFSSIIAESVATGDQHVLVQAAERIGVASSRLGSVIDSLLLLNRLSREEVRRESVNLSELAVNVAEELMKNTPGRKVNWMLAPDVTVIGFRSMLAICIQHLMANAFKFTAKKPLAVIEFGYAAGFPETVYYVKDNGEGFNTEYSNKLFEPFARLHSEAEFEGNGLGLSTVQRIIERHGGRIWAEAQEGRGATFFFTIAD